MSCSKKLFLLAVSLLIATSSAIGAVVVVPSGSTIVFTTGGTTPRYNIDGGTDANGIVENGAAKWVFADGLDIQAGATVTFGTASTPAGRPMLLVATSGNISIDTIINAVGLTPAASNAAGAGGPCGGYSGGVQLVIGNGPGGGGSAAWNGSGASHTGYSGGGAGYGGLGGRDSRVMALPPRVAPNPVDVYGGIAAPTYGDSHVYVLTGGSGGGGGKSRPGSGGGGGAIGLTAVSGNITIGSSAVIDCNGGAGIQDYRTIGGSAEKRYGGGGGSGGVIRLDAGAGSVTVNGKLLVMGGHGSNGENVSGKTFKWNDYAGGGAGGRIAIYTSTGTYTNNGAVLATGGTGGHFVDYQTPILPPPYTGDILNDPNVYNPAEDGAVGTIAPYTGHMTPLAYNPAPAVASTNISIFTDLQWYYGGGTSQDVYFETSVGSFGLIKHDAIGTLQQVTAAELQAAMGGPLADLTTYQWKVATNGDAGAAAIWSFTTGNSRAHDPVPADNAYETPYSTATVSWAADSSASSTGADIYFGTSAVDVGNRLVGLKLTASTPYHSVAVGTLQRGVRYYWLVDQKYGALTKSGTAVWTFRTVSKKLHLKTGNSDTGTTAWYNIDGAGDVAGIIDDANTARFVFNSSNGTAPNYFSYDSTWDVNVTGRRPCTVWSDGGISFDGRLNINGADARDASHKGGQGLAGGYNGGGDNATTYYDFPYPPTEHLNGPGHGFAGNIAVQNPGMTASQVSEDGGGAAYGGAGGYAGRFLSGFGGVGGQTYGQLQVYKLWGGSGGSGGGNCGGGSGGGAVEFYAKAGDITIGSNASITANGGTNDLPNAYPGGGGSGGSVRLVASGNVTVAGAVNANGGNGGGNGNGSVALNDPCDNGGGGGGGRIAVYAGGAYNKSGTVAATAGRRGWDLSSNSNAGNGQDGTVYTGKTSDLLKTHGIAPADGYRGWNASADPNFQQVSWYPALGSTTNTLYFGTNKTDVTNGTGGTLISPSYSDINGMTGQKVYGTGVLLANTKYYWRVSYQYGAGPVQAGPTYEFGTGKCTAQPAGDVSGDCKVTFVDFALMASQWKVCNLLPLGDCSL